MSIEQQKWAYFFPKMLRCVPLGICTDCSICILGRGAVELIARCACQREGAADGWWEEGLFPHIPFLLRGKTRCTSSENVEICSRSTLPAHSSRANELQKAFGCPRSSAFAAVPGRAFLHSLREAIKCCPRLCGSSPEKFLGLMYLCNQWILYNVSFKSGGGFFIPLYVWKCLWFPPHPS